MSTLGHTASLTFQNLTELISPLNYTGLTWWNGEERETELEQQLEELENFSILSFFNMIKVFFFLQLSTRCIKWDCHNLFNPFCSITDVWQIIRLKSFLTDTYLKTVFLFASFNKRMTQSPGLLFATWISQQASIVTRTLLLTVCKMLWILNLGDKTLTQGDRKVVFDIFQVSFSIFMKWSFTLGTLRIPCQC